MRDRGADMASDEKKVDGSGVSVSNHSSRNQEVASLSPQKSDATAATVGPLMEAGGFGSLETVISHYVRMELLLPLTFPQSSSSSFSQIISRI